MRKPWQLNRRTMIKGGGVALALPFLNVMSYGDTKKSQELPKRLLVTYFSYGCYEKAGEWNWWPGKTKDNKMAFNKSNSVFKPFQNELSYIRSLDHEGGYGLGGHSTGDIFSTGAYLSTKHKRNAISLDQVVAKEYEKHTRYSSLVLGTEGGTGIYGQAKTLSHYAEGKPIPCLNKPKMIFDKLFNPYGKKTIEQVRVSLKKKASLLDLLLDNSKDMQRRLGNEDKIKMEEYLESVRDLEKRILTRDKWTGTPLPKIKPSEINLNAFYDEPTAYIRTMYDLLHLAFRTDSTRAASLMLESESSTQSPVGGFASKVIGYKGQTHDIAHKRPIESGHWDKWRNEQHAYFLNKLKNSKEGDSNMLDRTVVLYGSAHPHGSHSNKNYPIQIAGGKALGLKHGYYIYNQQTKVPLANAYLSMLHAVGIKTKSFANSTEPLKELSI